MKTYHFGVIGSPIAHSLSPRLHEAALRHCGLSGSSQLVDIGRDDTAGLTAALEHFDALSVTMPLKEVVVARCNELDETAARIGGVNTVRRLNGILQGRNTDGTGLLDALVEDFGFVARGARCVVRGAGGAAKSIVDALSGAGAQSIVVLARNHVAAAELSDRYSVVTVNPVSLERVDLVVNTVPSDPTGVVLDEGLDAVRSRDAIALDIVYEPLVTPWLRARESAGWRTANGLSMLVHQARHQLEWWLERPVPLDILLAAVCP